MKFKDKYRFVRQNMKKNKSRLFMTILATSIGCCFLVVLASVGFGFQKSLTEVITSTGSLTEINVTKKDTTMPGLFTDDDVKFLENIKNVRSVVKRNIPNVPVRYHVGEFVSSAATSPTFSDIKAEEKGTMELSSGRYPQNENEVVVGYNFAENLTTAADQDKRFTGDILGQDLVIELSPEPKDRNKETFKIITKIVGVTEKPSGEWMKDANVFVDLRLLQDAPEFLFPKLNIQGKYQNVIVYADDMQHVSAITKKIQEKYHAHSVTSELKQIDNVFIFIKLGLLFVGGIAVLIAAIGIYNTMTMAVTERTQEIGIMKAIGASPSSIRSIFLLESSYIGMIGTIIGTAVAFLISSAVNAIIPMFLQQQGDKMDFVFSHIPLSLVLIAAAISIGVAILSGMRPARRATEIDVLKALRRDI